MATLSWLALSCSQAPIPQVQTAPQATLAPEELPASSSSTLVEHDPVTSVEVASEPTKAPIQSSVGEYQSQALGMQWSGGAHWDTCAGDAQFVACRDGIKVAIHAIPFAGEDVAEKQLLDLLLVREEVNPLATNLQKKLYQKNGYSVSELKIQEAETGLWIAKFYQQNGNAWMISISTKDISQATEAKLGEIMQGFKLLKATPVQDPQAVAQAQAKAWNELGLLQLAEEQPLSALAYFEKANRLDPSRPDYLLNCAFVYQLKDLNGPGASLLASQIELVKKDARLQEALGEMYEATYDYSNALPFYEMALNGQEANEEWMINLSDALWGVGQRQRSLEVVQNLYQEKPSARLASYLSKTLMGLDRYAEAVDLLTEAQQKFTTTEEMGVALLDAQLFLGNFQEALLASDALVKQYPNSAEIWADRGKALFHLKQFLPAQEALNKSLSLHEENDDAKSFLAATQAFLGNADTKALQKIITPAFARPQNLSALRDTQLVEEAKAEGFPAVVHWQQEAVRTSKDKPWVRTEALYAEILASAGASLFQEFTYSFLPGYDRLYINALEVYDSLGQLKSKWNPKQSYLTALANSEGNHDAQLAHLPVSGLSAGDRIFLQVSRTSIEDIRNPPFVHHHSSQDLPVGVDVFQVFGDLKEMRTEEYGGAEGQNIVGGMEWRVVRPVGLRNEPYMPSYAEMAAGVLLSGKHSWQDVGRDYQQLIQHQFKSSIPVREKAHEIRGNKPLDQAMLYRITGWVHDNIRYREIDFGGHSLIPALSLNTLNSRMGDCKDQALLLLEMLQAEGVQADLALIHLQEAGSLALPTIQQFNHMVVHVPASAKWPELWLDPTDKAQSHRPIPLDLEGKVSLLIKGDSSDAVVTPILENGQEHQAHVDQLLFLGNNGIAEFRDSLELYGRFAAGLRAKFLGVEKEQQDKMFQAWLSKQLPDVRVNGLRLSNLQDFSKPLRIVTTYQSQAYFARKGKAFEGAFPNVWIKAFLNLPHTAKRHHPLQIPHESKFQWSLRVRTSPGANIQIKPTAQDVRNPQYVQVAKSQFAKDRANLEWTTLAVFLEPESYGELLQEWDAVLEQSSPTILVK